MTESLPTSLQDCVAGSFHKTALLQKRVRELIKGASPLIDTREKNPIRVALMELQQGLIELTPDEEIHPVLMNPVAGLGAVGAPAPPAAQAASIVNDPAKLDDAAETKKSAPAVEPPVAAPGA
ncbi:MAG: DNA-directed RNA polymerase subunit omega [Planctomycetota bacterium]